MGAGKILAAHVESGYVAFLAKNPKKGHNVAKRYKYIYRDAKTGKIVTEEYARRHPSTTVRERVEV